MGVEAEGGSRTQQQCIQFASIGKKYHKLRGERGLGKESPLERRLWNSKQANCPKLSAFRETKKSYLSANANDNNG